MGSLTVSKGGWLRKNLLVQQNTLAGLGGLKDLFCSTLSRVPGAFEQVLAGLPQEWADYRTRYHMFIVYGQRYVGSKCLSLSARKGRETPRDHHFKKI